MNQNVADRPAPTKPPLHRRKFLINKSEQLKVAFYLTVAIATVIAVSSAILYRMMNVSIEAVMFSSHLKVLKLGDAFMPILVKVNIVYFVAVIAISCGLVFFLIYKLNVALRRLHFDVERAAHLDLSRPGNFSRIKLTSGLQVAFNEMVSSIEPDMASLSESSAKISKLTASDDIDVAKVKAEIKSIKDSLNRLTP
jgi:methyl-accepting chemotaxis protein